MQLLMPGEAGRRERGAKGGRGQLTQQRPGSAAAARCPWGARVVERQVTERAVWALVAGWWSRGRLRCPGAWMGR